MRKSIIVAASQNGVIGKDGKLPWHLPGDLKRFKALTMGHTLIMGRKTFESLPPKVRPLPGRTTIVLTRGGHKAESVLERAGAIVYDSLESAFYMAGQFEDHRDQDIESEPIGEDEVFVCGGGEVYREALPLCDRIYLTVVERDFEGDTHFAYPGLLLFQPRKVDCDGTIWECVETRRGEGEVPHRFEIWDRAR